MAWWREVQPSYNVTYSLTYAFFGGQPSGRFLVFFFIAKFWNSAKCRYIQPHGNCNCNCIRGKNNRKNHSTRIECGRDLRKLYLKFKQSFNLNWNARVQMKRNGWGCLAATLIDAMNDCRERSPGGAGVPGAKFSTRIYAPDSVGLSPCQ